MRGGFTLVECVLASSLLCLVMLGLFEGVIVSTRIAHENADVLAAEAVAWDAVWRRFNENFDGLATGEESETLDENQAPQLLRYDAAPVLKVKVSQLKSDEYGFSRLPTDILEISADVEWGPSANRRRLSEMSGIFGGNGVSVFRSRLRRDN